MTLRELEVFYNLSINTHVSAVAREMNLSQSAVSLSIKSLENKVGRPLFDRIGKRLILNENGRLFKDQTYGHFLALKDANSIFRGDGVGGLLRIASSKTIGGFIIPKIIFDFLIKYPNVSFKKDITNSLNIIHMVANGDIDMGFVETEFDRDEIIKETFAKDRLIVVSSDKSLSNGEVFIDTLFDKKWIIREEGSGTKDIFLQGLKNIKKKLPIFMESNEFDEIKTLLLNSRDTLSCLSEYVVKDEIKRGELFEVKLRNLNFKRNLYVIYHKNKHHSMLFKTFKDFVKVSID